MYESAAGLPSLSVPATCACYAQREFSTDIQVTVVASVIAVGLDGCASRSAAARFILLQHGRLSEYVMMARSPQPRVANMQLLIDFLPIVVFFVVYKIAGMYWATAAIVVAMSLQMGVQWLRERKVSNMLLISTALVAALGAITILLRNPLFIQWKPTVVNWLFAAGFLGSGFIGEKTLTQRLLGQAIELDRALWRQLNYIWVANFTILGAANLFVVYNFSEEAWVNFKLFGMLGLTLLTAIGQAIWIAAKTSGRHSGQEEM